MYRLVFLCASWTILQDSSPEKMMLYVHVLFVNRKKQDGDGDIGNRYQKIMSHHVKQGEKTDKRKRQA